MPELIEVELYRRAVVSLVGDRACDLETLDERYARYDSPEEVQHAVVGAALLGARRRGKLLLLDTDRGGIGLRFGMTGRLLVDDRGPIDVLEYGARTDDRRWDRLVVRFASGRTLTVNDPRRLGAVEVDPDEDALGPDAADLTVSALRRALRASRASLKARLLDQHRVAGLGNLLVDEALWRSGLAPTRDAGCLDAAEQRRLAMQVRATVRELTARGGSHTGDLHDERGPGGHCPRDGSPLRRERVGGRTTVWCPQHQV